MSKETLQIPDDRIQPVSEDVELQTGYSPAELVEREAALESVETPTERAELLMIWEKQLSARIKEPSGSIIEKSAKRNKIHGRLKGMVIMTMLAGVLSGIPSKSEAGEPGQKGAGIELSVSDRVAMAKLKVDYRLAYEKVLLAEHKVEKSSQETEKAKAEEFTDWNNYSRQLDSNFVGMTAAFDLPSLKENLKKQEMVMKELGIDVAPIRAEVEKEVQEKEAKQATRATGKGSSVKTNAEIAGRNPDIARQTDNYKQAVMKVLKIEDDINKLKEKKSAAKGFKKFGFKMAEETLSINARNARRDLAELEAGLRDNGVDVEALNNEARQKFASSGETK